MLGNSTIVMSQPEFFRRDASRTPWQYIRQYSDELFSGFRRNSSGDASFDRQPSTIDDPPSRSIPHQSSAQFKDTLNESNCNGVANGKTAARDVFKINAPIMCEHNAKDKTTLQNGGARIMSSENGSLRMMSSENGDPYVTSSQNGGSRVTLLSRHRSSGDDTRKNKFSMVVNNNNNTVLHLRHRHHHRHHSAEDDDDDDQDDVGGSLSTCCKTERLFVDNFSCSLEEDLQNCARDMDISTGHIVLSYMEDHVKNSDRLSREWQALTFDQTSPAGTTNEASKPCNMRKNRLTGILPFDDTRVKLEQSVNVSGGDYINATIITDHDPRKPAYIVTQGPLPHTVADFWQMVWEQDCVVIVNLTSLTEDEVPKCHQYWPVQGCDVYHIYEVQLVSEHVWCSDFVVRSLFLKNIRTGDTRTVTQYHYMSWPDNGLPPSKRNLLEFRRKVNRSYRGQSCPIVVHCSDGAGRSGTYCLIDTVLTRLAKGAKELDIAATLEHFRDQHMHLVGSKEQFEFALMTVAEEVESSLRTMQHK